MRTPRLRRPCWVRAVGARRSRFISATRATTSSLGPRPGAARRNGGAPRQPDVSARHRVSGVAASRRVARRSARRRPLRRSWPCRRTGLRGGRARRRAAHSAATRCSSAPPRDSRTDTLQRMSEVIAEETGTAASGRRAVRAELCGGGRAPAADGARRRVGRRGGRAVRCRRSSADRRFRLYGSDDVVGVEIGAALKNIIAIAAGCRRVAAARPQRAGGAHHARPGRDLASGVRDGRPARDAGRPERSRRSRADVHGRAQPQPARRHRARPRPAARRDSRAACGWSPKACARRRAALALGARHRRRAADCGADGRSAGRPRRRPREAVGASDAAAAARRSSTRAADDGVVFRSDSRRARQDGAADSRAAWRSAEPAAVAPSGAERAAPPASHGVETHRGARGRADCGRRRPAGDRADSRRRCATIRAARSATASSA